jgi:N-dimethylarginine dimethylaminohydrolase
MRTNFEAAEALMEKDLLGTQRLAVVHDDFEKCQDRMHLDCVFNILGKDCCILAEDIIGADKPFRRTVDEYARSGPGQPYLKTARSGMEFSAFLISEGFNIIPISREMQLEYGCNALNLGRGNVLTCHAGAARVIARSPHFTGDLEHVDFGSITSMYGALHCSSQVCTPGLRLKGMGVGFRVLGLRV